MNLKIKLFIIVIILLISALFLNKYITDVSALEKINITVENTSIQELRLTYCKLKLKVNISNPTTEYISELSAEFDISIAGTYVGNGSVPKVSIPIQSYNTKDVPLIIYYADVGKAVIDGIQARNFDLAINGKAKVNVLFSLIMISKSFTATYSYS